ncbi:hypothetical protein K438DRAFT_2073393 [Mycena galopus ATCC 62051]|nr:hypothetical protein K438DRAFT_2073393 [Mycena galopus ATCC 62051]
MTQVDRRLSSEWILAGGLLPIAKSRTAGSYEPVSEEDSQRSIRMIPIEGIENPEAEFQAECELNIRSFRDADEASRMQLEIDIVCRGADGVAVQIRYKWNCEIGKKHGDFRSAGLAFRAAQIGAPVRRISAIQLWIAHTTASNGPANSFLCSEDSTKHMEKRPAKRPRSRQIIYGLQGMRSRVSRHTSRPAGGTTPPPRLKDPPTVTTAEVSGVLARKAAGGVTP